MGIDDLDVAMLRADPATDALESPWTNTAGLAFGRMLAENGPTGRSVSFVAVSTTVSSGDLKPARYARFPSRPQMVLCEPDFGTILAITSPVIASTTCQ